MKKLFIALTIIFVGLAYFALTKSCFGEPNIKNQWIGFGFINMVAALLSGFVVAHLDLEE